jgi:hypothetical protein
MFLESTGGAFGGVDAMIVRRDQLDLHLVGSDVFFECLGAFIVHDV